MTETTTTSADIRHDEMDSAFRAQISELTAGLSPIALTQAYLDWALHLAGAPGKQQELAQLAAKNMQDFARYLAGRAAGDEDAQAIAPERQDRRFRHEGWKQQPFHAMQQGFLLTEAWWDAATSGVRGVSKANERAVNFVSRQLLDAVSPSNFLASNPEILEKTRETKGQNLVDGAQNLSEDLTQMMSGEKPPLPEGYELGKTLAATPGKVVFRNHLIELIRYDPVTDKVQPDPILITPAWIMKYYILDLSAHNSMVKYLVDQGFTVFMISWRNPDKSDSELGMQDYLNQGPLAALDEIQKLTKADRIHGVGYCLGGTLMSIAAATLARDGDERLASVTLLAAQMDFTEAGEIMLFINEGEVAFLEDMMRKHGYLEAEQMAGAFTLLRSNDMIWSRIQHEYLMGERSHPNDIMAWNADSTRMPYKMHSQYLRELFLDNAFASGRFIVGDHPVTPRDISVPIFAVGTETDHVAPWPSAYKTGALTRGEVTFVLTNGGHNAGIVSEPGHKRRHYRMGRIFENGHHVPASEWSDGAQMHEGSWWDSWSAWLKDHQSGDAIKPPKVVDGLCPAPGTYVMMR